MASPPTLPSALPIPAVQATSAQGTFAATPSPALSTVTLLRAASYTLQSFLEQHDSDTPLPRSLCQSQSLRAPRKTPVLQQRYSINSSFPTQLGFELKPTAEETVPEVPEVEAEAAICQLPLAFISAEPVADAVTAPSFTIALPSAGVTETDAEVIAPVAAVFLGAAPCIHHTVPYGRYQLHAEDASFLSDLVSQHHEEDPDMPAAPRALSPPIPEPYRPRFSHAYLHYHAIPEEGSMTSTAAPSLLSTACCTPAALSRATTYSDFSALTAQGMSPSSGLSRNATTNDLHGMASGWPTLGSGSNPWACGSSVSVSQLAHAPTLTAVGIPAICPTSLSTPGLFVPQPSCLSRASTLGDLQAAAAGPCHPSVLQMQPSPFWVGAPIAAAAGGSIGVATLQPPQQLEQDFAQQLGQACSRSALDLPLCIGSHGSFSSSSSSWTHCDTGAAAAAHAHSCSKSTTSGISSVAPAAAPMMATLAGFPAYLPQLGSEPEPNTPRLLAPKQVSWPELVSPHAALPTAVFTASTAELPVCTAEAPACTAEPEQETKEPPHILAQSSTCLASFYQTKLLGQGTFADVYMWDVPLPSGCGAVELACKRVRADCFGQRRFKREVEGLMACRGHPFVLHLYGASPAESAPYTMFLEYAGKGCLQDLIDWRHADLKMMNACSGNSGNRDSSALAVEAGVAAATADGATAQGAFEQATSGVSSSSSSTNVVSGAAAAAAAAPHMLMPEEHVRWYAVRMLSGLAHVHGRKYMHRDIKPANVFLSSRTGAPLLADFDYAEQLPADERCRGFAGTLSFVAPEVLRAATRRTLSYGPKADVYSMGMVLWLLCGGEVPRDGPGSAPKPAGPLQGMTKKLFRFLWGKAGLLAESEDARPTVAGAMAHAWLAGMDWEGIDAGELAPYF